jgi:hypothetical protein
MCSYGIRSSTETMPLYEIKVTGNLTTCESVKPVCRFAALWAGPPGKTSKVATEASNASASVANKWTGFPILTPLYNEGGRSMMVAPPSFTHPPQYTSIHQK